MNACNYNSVVFNNNSHTYTVSTIFLTTGFFSLSRCSASWLFKNLKSFLIIILNTLTGRWFRNCICCLVQTRSGVRRKILEKISKKWARGHKNTQDKQTDETKMLSKRSLNNKNMRSEWMMNCWIIVGLASMCWWIEFERPVFVCSVRLRMCCHTPHPVAHQICLSNTD